ncbi:hypothetical protein OIO90_005704 [Microbotryomycetes sp. JL221]|nr:hypothetical protein OIO90_005704 [Microbotryomycetes sp. JL221]
MPSKDDTAPLSPNSLDSLTTLYNDAKLQPAQDQLFQPDGKLNDKIVLWQGDITHLAVDAILNAANKSLLGGGGIDGAIHRAAGPELKQECKQLNGAETGQVKMTKGYKLPAKHVLHAVGPVYNESKAQDCEDKLRSCYRNALKLVYNNGLRSVALCGISTGIYGYPLEDAVPVALEEVRTFLDSKGDEVDHVIFCVFRPVDVEMYEEQLPRFFPPTSTPPRPIPQPSSSQKLSDLETAPPESDDPSTHDSTTNAALVTAHEDPSSMTNKSSRGETVALPKALGSVKKGLAQEQVGPEETVRGEVAKGATVDDI